MPNSPKQTNECKLWIKETTSKIMSKMSAVKSITSSYAPSITNYFNVGHLLGGGADVPSLKIFIDVVNSFYN